MASTALSEPEGTNYDESKVPQFGLPDALLFASGERVDSASKWHARRAEILSLFETHVYGRAPDVGESVYFAAPRVDTAALGGKARRKQVKIFFGQGKQDPAASLLIYLPAGARTPVPIFVGLNFGGNHSTTNENGVLLPTSWMRDRNNGAVVDHRATEAGRGKNSSRWPYVEAIARGYGVATLYCGDIDPDFDDGFQNGVHPLHYAQGQTKPRPDEWGTIAAWAWGLSRALDYFESDAEIDHKRVAVLGHSRLGKTALWAGACDERFAMVISNNSGCGGAALSRRQFGETVRMINQAMPHWFCANFHQYNDNEKALPVDQHMLAALVAPRPLYVASAEEDLWADPRGEFLSLKFASPVYELLGKRAFGDVEMPSVDQPLLRDVAYHVRSGKHDITLYDWQRYMDFADRHFQHRFSTQQ